MLHTDLGVQELKSQEHTGKMPGQPSGPRHQAQEQTVKGMDLRCDDGDSC